MQTRTSVGNHSQPHASPHYGSAPEMHRRGLLSIIPKQRALRHVTSRTETGVPISSLCSPLLSHTHLEPFSQSFHACLLIGPCGSRYPTWGTIPQNPKGAPKGLRHLPQPPMANPDFQQTKGAAAGKQARTAHQTLRPCSTLSLYPRPANRL